MSHDDDRLRLVSNLWGVIRGLTTENVRNYPAAARAIDAGADPADVVTAMTAAAYEATFSTLFRLTAEEDLSALADSGVAIALHEDLLTADPTGLEGVTCSAERPVCRDPLGHADARARGQKAVEDFRPDHDNGPTCMGCHGRSRGSNPAKEGALHERTVLLGCEAV